MCGIIGFTGQESCSEILVDGLAALEYRGYDSAGIAVQGASGIEIVKSAGKLEALRRKITEYGTIGGTCGIGHTRWATHGEPSDLNAHPHRSGKVTLVHNGIIENYAALRESLVSDGYTFISETDTEIAAALIDLKYRETKDPITAIRQATGEIRGSFAFGIIFGDIPGKIFAIRRDSPLIAAQTESGSLIASDITAILPHTRKYFRPSDDITAVLDGKKITFVDKNGDEIKLTCEEVTWDTEDAKRGGYPHFMLKEIAEESEVLRRTMTSKLSESMPSIDSAILDGKIGRIHIAACGTAMHAGLYGKYFIEKLAGIPVTVNIASEFRYADPLMDENDIVLLISQSGETADTLASLRHAKSRGIRTLAVVNVVGSTVSREADEVIYTSAGPEIAVASTKAYIVQCAVLYLVAMKLALSRGKISADECSAMCSRFLDENIRGIESAFRNSKKTAVIARELAKHEHIFYIGRGIDSHLCVEGSLKLKEISYIHSEAYAAGELKHGTISLIEDGTPVVAVITEIGMAEKMISGIREVKARGGMVTVFTTDEIVERYEIPSDDMITIPITSALAPLPVMTSLQLLAYSCAVERGLDPDKPRNLAKSVTVE